MSEKHWSIVMRTNSLLCGVHPPQQVEKEVTLPNGRTTTIPEVTESIPSKKAYYPGALTQKKEQEEQETKFHIPRFHINDKTNIDIFETPNSHEKTVADAGYTQDGFSAAVGGSYGPVGGGVSAGFNKTQKTATTNTNSRDKKHLHVTYNYPRVKLQLDEDQLELSQECKAGIHKLRKERTQAVLDHFYRNPSAWCSTVASFYNWRVMQRTKLVSLIEHIAKLPDYTDVPFLVRNIANVYADKDHSLFAELGTAIMEEMHNTGGEKGQKMRDDVKAQQITVTNVLEMLALAMVPGTSLQSVIDIMKDDPDLKPYANYVWYSVVGGGDGRGPQIITSLSGMPLLFYPK
ncbi:hypothetical protein N7507_004592 [Penicillium longicatenatum]|nr:hypothetical protein N7507_004592 [Penicillium longicatenatum]